MRRLPGIAAPLPLLALLALASCDDQATAPQPEISALAVVVAPGIVNPGEVFRVAPVVELRSGDGRPLATSGVLVTVAATRGLLSGSTSAVTDERGRAQFPDLSIEGEPGAVRLEFGCCGLPVAIATLTLSQGTGLIARSPTTVTGKVGTPVFGLAVRALDERGIVVRGAEVRFELGSGRLPATSITTNSDGVARLPTFALSLIVETEVMTATRIATGESVTFHLVSTPDPKARVVGAAPGPVAAVGETVPLPGLLLTNGLPVEGAAVSYRLVEGDGVLSTETALTDATGTSEPVTLTLGERSMVVVEFEAAGYSSVTTTVTVLAVVPPVVFAYPEPCRLDCPPFDFTFNEWGANLEIEVRDAVGRVRFFPVTLTPTGDAGWLVTLVGEVDLRAGGTVLTDGNGVFGVWWAATHSGTHSITLSGPLIENGWTYQGTP